MVLSYLRTAFRNLFRHRLYVLVNIFGLAVGMAACMRYCQKLWLGVSRASASLLL